MNNFNYLGLPKRRSFVGFNPRGDKLFRRGEEPIECPGDFDNFNIEFAVTRGIFIINNLTHRMAYTLSAEAIKRVAYALDFLRTEHPSLAECACGPFVGGGGGGAGGSEDEEEEEEERTVLKCIKLIESGRHVLYLMVICNEGYHYVDIRVYFKPKSRALGGRRAPAAPGGPPSAHYVSATKRGIMLDLLDEELGKTVTWINEMTQDVQIERALEFCQKPLVIQGGAKKEADEEGPSKKKQRFY